MKDINLIKIKDSIYLKEISNKSQLSSEEDCDGYLLKTSESEARRIIDSLKGAKGREPKESRNKIIAFHGGENSVNRRALETLKIDYLVSPESGQKRDSLKQRDSGINQVLAKIAAKNKIPIVINLSEVSKLSGKEKALRIERIIQNISVCKKTGCEIKIASLASLKKDLIDEKARKSFGISLGMSSQQSKNSTKFNDNI